MGIVKIPDELHEDLRQASKAMARSINAQAEHWLRIGMLAELNPELTYAELSRHLLLNQGQDLQGMASASGQT